MILLLIILIDAKANEMMAQLNDNNCGKSYRSATNYIIGGTNASLGEYPFMVSLQEFDNFHFCGATILNERWILTAAHCFDGQKATYGLKAVIGSIDKNDNSLSFSLQKIIIHRCYEKKSEFSADIALVKTTKPMPISEPLSKKHKTGSVCLPPQDANPISDSGILLGWGIWKPFTMWQLLQNKHKKIPDFLQQIDTYLYPLQYCSILRIFGLFGCYYEGMTDNTICVKSPSGSACIGDSGGPLIQVYDDRYYQLGVTSHTSMPCNDDGSVFYTQVSHYINWIEHNIKQYDNSDSRDIIRTSCK